MTKIRADQPGTLYIRTLELLNNDSRDMITIHRESGLPFYWLREFKMGKIKSPSANRLQMLYEFCTDSKLTLL